MLVLGVEGVCAEQGVLYWGSRALGFEVRGAAGATGLGWGSFEWIGFS